MFFLRHYILEVTAS